MKSSFADADQTTVPPVPTTTPEAAAPIPTSAALAVPEQKSTAVVPDSYFHNDVEGEVDRSDMKMPRLAVAQLTGDLSNKLNFTPGHFVFQKEVDLGHEGVEVTFVKLRKYYSEHIPFDPNGSEMPQFFTEAEDARRAGFLPIGDMFNMEKAAKGSSAEHKFYKPMLDADLLIKGKPEHTSLPLDFEGVPYAFARWTLQSTAYSRVGKNLLTDTKLALRKGLATKFYKLSTKKELLNGNWTFVPRAQLVGPNSDAFIAWVGQLRG